ncbi:MAG: putative Cul4b protein [Streblomastix strix]|uniref:Putative Cul4b protein n=1 Tax=Streblomastix strix TaxID=222440 RepID=A0A5J4VND1_9EUKA|nr:MAG: putative Cul4b protein [Streblomastix strix]
MQLSNIEKQEIKTVDQAWTQYLKPMIDDIKDRIEGDVKEQRFSINHMLRFTGVVSYVCSRLESTPKVAQLALKIFEDNCDIDIKGILKPLLSGPYLSELARRWEKYKIFVKIVNILFQYLSVHHFNYDQPTGESGQMRTLTLQQRAYDIFRERIFTNENKTIQRLTLHFIDRDRAGEAVDSTMLKNAVDLFIAMDGTLEKFYIGLEREILNRARQFYQQMAQRTIEQDSVPEYMIRCEEAYALENQRVTNYMNILTQKKMRDVLDDELLKKYANRLIVSKESGFLTLVEHDKVEDLARMYRLMTHLDIRVGIQPMVQDFRIHIESIGENLMLTQDVLPERAAGKRVASGGQADGEGEEEEEKTTKKKKKKAAIMVKDDEEQEQEVGIKKKKKKKKKAELIRDDDADEAPIGTEARIVEAGEGEAVVEAKAGGLQNELEKLSQVSAFVEQLLNLYKKYNRMYVESFQKYTLFNDSIKAAFTQFLNRTPDEGKRRFAELLAVYVDELMKSQAATALDDQIKTRFDEIVAVLQYVQNRDIFQGRNEALLSRRILDQGSDAMPQEEAEKAFIVKLKQSFGDVFAIRLYNMFSDINDIALQTDIQNQFKEYIIDQNIDLGLELQVQILTKAHWQRLQTMTMNLPDNLQNALQSFERFYRDQQSNRRLEWIHSQGSMLVQVFFEKKKCNITMQVIQALISIKFANGATQTIGGIATQLGIENTEARRHIDSLMGKIPLLVKVNSGSEEDGNELKDDDELMLNKQHQPKKINIRMPRVGLSEESGTKVTTQIIEERKQSIDIALVHTLRICRTMKYNDLVNSVISQITNFHPSGYDVRQRVEDLMTRDFMKRNDKDSDSLDFIY